MLDMQTDGFEGDITRLGSLGSVHTGFDSYTVYIVRDELSKSEEVSP